MHKSFFEGAWRNWLAHQTVDLVVASSSLVAPASKYRAFREFIAEGLFL